MFYAGSRGLLNHLKSLHSHLKGHRILRKIHLSYRQKILHLICRKIHLAKKLCNEGGDLIFPKK
jgi:hypothetical protein